MSNIKHAVFNGQTRRPPPGASNPQCEASIELDHHGFPGAEEYDLIDAGDEQESSTESATPCICEGGPGVCGAQQHELIEQRSFR